MNRKDYDKAVYNNKLKDNKKFKKLKNDSTLLMEE